MINTLKRIHKYLRESLKFSRMLSICFWTILVVIIFIPIVAVVCYCIKFYGSSLSPDITLWGYFGDFWWNLITAVSSLLNVFAFIFVTSIVARMQKDQSSNTLEKQQKFENAKFKIDIINHLQSEMLLVLKNGATQSSNYFVVNAVLISFEKTYLPTFFNTEEIKNKHKELSDIVKKNSNNQTTITTTDRNDFLTKKDAFINSLLTNAKQDINDDIK